MPVTGACQSVDATVHVPTKARISSHAAALAFANSVAPRSKKLCGAPG